MIWCEKTLNPRLGNGWHCFHEYPHKHILALLGPIQCHCTDKHSYNTILPLNSVRK